MNPQTGKHFLVPVAESVMGRLEETNFNLIKEVEFLVEIIQTKGSGFDSTRSIAYL